MKFTGNLLKGAGARARKPTTIPRLAGRLMICGLLAGCSPAPDTVPPPPVPKESAPAAVPTSVVSIPEEFLSPTPTPKPSVLPRVVFATSDFQVTTQHGIQGIRAGEAVDFLREEGGDFVVRFRGLEFRKSRSYFAATYVEHARPAPTPVAGENAQASGHASAEPALSGEQRTSGLIPGDDPAQVAGQRKVGELTDSIRGLNDQIRSAQEELDRKSARTSGGDAESAQDIKKAARAIQRLKEKRDELSGQLTEMGKP
jgi:hypothetical protein